MSSHWAKIKVSVELGFFWSFEGELLPLPFPTTREHQHSLDYGLYSSPSKPASVGQVLILLQFHLLLLHLLLTSIFCLQLPFLRILVTEGEAGNVAE